ncbi:MAG: DUF3108 domain-containing protein [Luteitalea sp.]|nr:DUF3108 domain-containing protein [Luteitalea sp.]
MTLLSVLRPACFYLVITLVVTWPAAVSLTSHLIAPIGPGDPYLNLWVLGWDLSVLFSDPIAFLDGRVFDAPIFHPATQTLAYSDHLLPQALLVAPIYAVSGQNLVLCYNLLLLGSLWGSALAMYVFARSITGSTVGALMAGLVWGFWPYHFSHLIHLALQGTYVLPLAFLFLHRLMAGRRWRDVVGLGVTAGINAASSVYYGVIGALGLAVAALALLVSIGARRRGALVGRLLIAGAVGVVVIAPILRPYWQVQQREGFGRVLIEAARHAATPSSYASVPPTNLLYGVTGALAEARSVEDGLFVGVVALVLALFGVWHGWRRDAKPLVWAMLALIIVGGLLSLGPDGARSVYAALHRWVFGFHAVRAPARFAILVAFGVAVLAAVGLGKRYPVPFSGSFLPILLILLACVEYLNRPLTLVSAPPLTTQTGAWLARAKGPGAVVYLPLARDLGNTPFMLQTLEHRRPIVNGYSGQRPMFYSALSDALAGFPSSDALWTLDELDVRFVVTNRAVDTTAWPLVERARVRDPTLGPETRIYELAESSELEARLGPAAVPPPPPAGPIPFEVGERATYRVLWVSAGTSLPAGRATFEVQPGGTPAQTPGVQPLAGGAHYRFVVTAATAPWVARFFEARDQFATWTDGALFPLLHERHLREGRRTVDLLIHYEREKQTATMLRPRAGGVEREMSFRVAKDVRDPLAVFFYVRTLELASGQRVRVPITDMGRTMVLEVLGRRVESVNVQGKQVEALRIEAGLQRRVETRQPPEIRVWLSGDARRLPILAEVRAGFGALRLELDNYARTESNR